MTLSAHLTWRMCAHVLTLMQCSCNSRKKSKICTIDTLLCTHIPAKIGCIINIISMPMPIKVTQLQRISCGFVDVVVYAISSFSISLLLNLCASWSKGLPQNHTQSSCILPLSTSMIFALCFISFDSFRPTSLPAAIIFAVTVTKLSMLHATPYLCNKRTIFALAMLCANYFVYCLHQCCLNFRISFLQQNIWNDLFIDTLPELHRILYHIVRIKTIDLNVVCNF